MGSDSNEKVVSIANSRAKYIALFCFVLCMVLVVFSQDFVTSLQLEDTYAEIIKPASASGTELGQPFDLSRFDKCNDTVFHLEDPKTFSTKPLWFTMQPFILREEVHRGIVNSLTGTKYGGKSFYASIRGVLRHCIGKGQTVTCMNQHPTVKMNSSPDNMSDKFYSKYIMVLRNPMTAFPASYYTKSAKYSGTSGQLPEEKWRLTRDDWFEGMIESFKEMIRTWDHTHYDLGMYLVYEDLYDATKGPSVLKELGSLLQDANFSVAPEEDLDCIWYNALGKEDLEQFHKHRFEYNGYIPGYTQEQKDRMVEEMESMKNNFSICGSRDSRSCERLADILDQYIAEVKSNTKIDMPATRNGTIQE